MTRQQLPSPLFKLIHILDNLATNKKVQGKRVREIAEAFSYPTVTTYNYLAKLEKLGFIKRSYEANKRKDEAKIVINILK